MAIVVLAMYVGEAATYMLFITRIRYRLPFDPLLFVMASGVFADWLRRWQETRQAALALPASAPPQPGSRARRLTAGPA